MSTNDYQNPVKNSDIWSNTKKQLISNKYCIRSSRRLSKTTSRKHFLQINRFLKFMWRLIRITRITQKPWFSVKIIIICRKTINTDSDVQLLSVLTWPHPKNKPLNKIQDIILCKNWMTLTVIYQFMLFYI